MTKNVISKKDYERYTINLPFRTILGRNRSRYVFGELEKLHPCFTSESCFDSKLKFGKHGLKSDVVVMSGLRLAEYKARFPGRRLYIEENQKKPVFRNKYRVSKLSAIGIFAVFALALILTLHKKSEKIVSADNCAGYETETAEEASISFSEVCAGFFEAMQKKNGRILEFELKSDGLNQRFNAFVSGMYPEDFDFIKNQKCRTEISSLSYRENMPFCNLKTEVKVKRMEQQIMWTNAGATGNEKVQNHKMEIRKIISDSRAVLLEEMTSPWGIRFCIKNMDVMDCEDLIQKISNYAFENKVGISSMSIKKVSENSLEVGIKSNEQLGYFEGVDIGVLKKNLNLFALKKKPSVVSIPVISKGEDLPLGNGKKLGEIIHQNGTKTIFFRNQNGKLEKKEEAL